MSAARKRPVITVVDARPMNEVGFRGASVTSPTGPPVPSQVPSGPVASSGPSAASENSQLYPSLTNITTNGSSSYTPSGSAATPIRPNQPPPSRPNFPPPKPKRSADLSSTSDEQNISESSAPQSVAQQSVAPQPVAPQPVARARPSVISRTTVTKPDEKPVEESIPSNPAKFQSSSAFYTDLKPTSNPPPVPSGNMTKEHQNQPGARSSGTFYTETPTEANSPRIQLKSMTNDGNVQHVDEKKSSQGHAPTVIRPGGVTLKSNVETTAPSVPPTVQQGPAWQGVVLRPTVDSQSNEIPPPNAAVKSSNDNSRIQSSDHTSKISTGDQMNLRSNSENNNQPGSSTEHSHVKSQPHPAAKQPIVNHPVVPAQTDSTENQKKPEVSAASKPVVMRATDPSVQPSNTSAVKPVAIKRPKIIRPGSVCVSGTNYTAAELSLANSDGQTDDITKVSPSTKGPTSPPPVTAAKRASSVYIQDSNPSDTSTAEIRKNSGSNPTSPQPTPRPRPLSMAQPSNRADNVVPVAMVAPTQAKKEPPSRPAPPGRPAPPRPQPVKTSQAAGGTAPVVEPQPVARARGEQKPVTESQSEKQGLSQQSSKMPEKVPPPGSAVDQRPGTVPPPRPAASEGPGKVPPPRPAMAAPPPPRPSANPKRPEGPVIKPAIKAATVGGAPQLPPRPSLGHPLYHYVVTDPHAVAIHDYDSTHPDELCFKAGDLIILSKWVNEEWLEGRTMKNSGIFPASFVDIIKTPDGVELKHVVRENPSCVAVTSPPSPPPVRPVFSGPSCLARFDYDAEEPDDLGFKSGDVIKLLEKIGDEWLRGELNGRMGIFPLAFVEILENLPEVSGGGSAASGGSQSGAGVQVKAIHEFHGRMGELFFQNGATITVLSEVDEEWLYGEVDGYRGKFPKDYIEYVPVGLPMFGADQKNKQEQQNNNTVNQDDGQPYCIALYDFVGHSATDLSFTAGDRITLICYDGPDWLKGSLRGMVGSFPIGYVRIERDVQNSQAYQPQPTVPSYGGYVPHDVTDSYQPMAGPQYTGHQPMAGPQYTGHQPMAAPQYTGHQPMGGPQYTGHQPMAGPQYMGHQQMGGPQYTSHQPMAGPQYTGHQLMAGPQYTGHPGSPQLESPTANAMALLGAGSGGHQHPSSSQFVVAKFDFTGEGGDDLSFKSGERIEILERLDVEWLRGRIGERVGMFPCAFVDMPPAS